MTEVRVTWTHCGFTVHIKEVYMEDVRSQELYPPAEESGGYGKQMWLSLGLICFPLFSRGMVTQSLVCTDTPPTTQVRDY